MYRCKECKSLYKEKIDYCDCGNNVFEEIPDAPINPIKETSDDREVELRRPILPVNWLSLIVFSLCCIFSLCFILFLGPEPKKKEKTPTTKEKVVVKDIPDIDKIWDDTPAYKVSSSSVSDLDMYKSGLRNALMANLDTIAIAGEGTCEIQFFLDDHGNLKKKKLYQNTANKPLTNAVKKMLSAVKKYNPPPQGYEGSTIIMEVIGSGENYQLRYKN